MTAESSDQRSPDLIRRDEEVFLRGACCQTCGVTMFPARDHCFECLGETTPITFDRRAELESFTEVHAGNPAFDSPYAAGFVRLSPGYVRTFTYLDGDVDEFAVGAPVVLAVGRVGNRDDWLFRLEDHAA